MFSRRVSSALLFIIIFPVSLFASPADELKSAASAGKTAFVLVTAPGADSLEQAKEVTRGAMKQVAGSVIVELDRSDTANAPLVQQYRLLGAPVPLILVFASNGVLSGGIPAQQATPELLVKMIPTPKKAEVLKALESGCCVLVTAGRKGMASHSKVVDACAAACGKMQSKSQAIQMDMDDPTEEPFFNELKIDRQSKEPVTVVINAQGQITGTYSGVVEIGSLVQAATKKVGGCCPGGKASGGAACGPTKK